MDFEGTKCFLCGETKCVHIEFLKADFEKHSLSNSPITYTELPSGAYAFSELYVSKPIEEAHKKTPFQESIASMFEHPSKSLFDAIQLIWNNSDKEPYNNLIKVIKT